MQDKKIPGVEFREAYFTPTFSKQAGKVCGGVQVHVTDPAEVEAITAATHMMVEARRLYPEFDWRGDAGRWADLLTGSHPLSRHAHGRRAGRGDRGRLARGALQLEPPTRRSPALPWCAAMRALRPAAAAVGCAALLGATLLQPAASASAARSQPHGSAGRYDRPQDGFARAGTMLRDGSPASAGLDPAPIRDALDQIAGWEEPSGAHPAAVRRRRHADGP